MADSPLDRARRLVWNADQRRLRAPIRLPLGIVLLFLVGLALSVGAGVLSGALALDLGDGLAGQTVSTAVATLVPLVGVYVVSRVLDRRWFTDFGFHLDADWWLDCAFGAALGAVLMAGIFLLELAAGWVTVTGYLVVEPGGSFAAAFAGAVVLFVGVSVREELLLRGYLLTNLAEGGVGLPGLSPRGAVVLATVLSSGVFGLLHASNPNATALSTASIGVAGVFLALGYLLTGELAIPIGLHLTWNLFQGTVFGFPVSGLGFGVSVVGIEQSGPTVATGGSFGPEAGLTGLTAMVLGSALTVAWVRWRTGTAALDPAVWTPDLRWRSSTPGAATTGGTHTWEATDEWTATGDWAPATERLEEVDERTETETELAARGAEEPQSGRPGESSAEDADPDTNTDDDPDPDTDDDPDPDTDDDPDPDTDDDPDPDTDDDPRSP
jgi:hypothetical protein